MTAADLVPLTEYIAAIGAVLSFGLGYIGGYMQ